MLTPKPTPPPTLAPTPRPAVAAPALTAVEVRAFYDFYNRAVAAIAAVRQFAKNNPEVALPVPEYPPNHEVVKQVCLRLGGHSQ